MLMTMKVLSALLSYPTADLKEATGEIAEVLRGDGVLSGAIAEALQPLLDDLASRMSTSCRNATCRFSTGRARCR